jgi:transposase
MNLDDQIAKFLADADARPARSKLEPYAKLIRELRQRRWTYRKIAAALADRFGIRASPSTIHDFLRVRAHQPHGRKPEAPTKPPSSTAKPAADPPWRFHIET